MGSATEQPGAVWATAITAGATGVGRAAIALEATDLEVLAAVGWAIDGEEEEEEEAAAGMDDENEE